MEAGGGGRAMAKRARLIYESLCEIIARNPKALSIEKFKCNDSTHIGLARSGNLIKIIHAESLVIRHCGTLKCNAKAKMKILDLNVKGIL